jgi:myo-inositol-1(or 4)-monophosphatase
VGSLALTLCYVAAGRFDGMIGARPSRSVDVAAAQLIVREAGGDVKFDRLDLSEAHLGLDARYEIAAALDEEMLGTLLEVQRAAARKR